MFFNIEFIGCGLMFSEDYSMSAELGVSKSPRGLVGKSGTMCAKE